MKRLMAASLVVLLFLNSALAAEPAPIAKKGPEAAAPSLRVPEGFRAAAGTTAEPYTNTGWAKEIVGAAGDAFVFIPAGEFLMGSPAGEAGRDEDETQHRVQITKPLYMGEHEVTVGQFRRFVEATGYSTDAERGDGAYGWTGTTYEKRKEFNWRNPGFAQTDDHPVTCVNWNDAQAYCRWAAVRLPTEAEREYACRAGSTGRFWWGESETSAGQHANVADRTAKRKHSNWTIFDTDDGHAETAPVGSFRANAWGLYDMHGNVWEWCEDWYGSYASGTAVDPNGPTNGEYRVLRGGSWDRDPQLCRSAHRVRLYPSSALSNLGFRVVVSPRP